MGTIYIWANPSYCNHIICEHKLRKNGFCLSKSSGNLEIKRIHVVDKSLSQNKVMYVGICYSPGKIVTFGGSPTTTVHEQSLLLVKNLN